GPRAEPCVHESATTGNVAREGHVVRAIEGEGAVVDDVANDPSRRAAVSDLQRARGNRRAAGVAVDAGEDEGRRAALGQAAGAADLARKYPVRGLVDRQRPAAQGNVGRSGQVADGRAESVEIEQAAIENH